MASGSNSRGLVLLLITSCFFITGILFDYMPMIIDDHIKRTIELATNEEIISYWQRPPVDVNSYYWLYEVANPDQFHAGGEKAQVRQLGPFHFVSRLEKRIIGLSANKFRLTYNATRFMRLNESYSHDQLDRPVTLPNPFYASILEGVRTNANELDGQSRAIAYGSINRLTERYNESILQRNTTARQALLGRPMPIVAKLAKMAQTMGMEGRMPELSSSGNYGYVALSNDTLTGPFEIYTGYQETARSLGELISYKGKRRLAYYEGKCNRMQTSAGELRPMPIDPDKRLEMFQPSFCRIIHLEPTGQHKLREGVAVGYSMSPDDFASATSNPDNRCFCVNSSGLASPTDNNPLDDNHCSLDGVIDLGPCSYGAPLLVAPSSMQLDSRITSTLNADFDPELLRGEVSEIDLADDKSQVLILKRIGVPIRADITITLFLRVVRDPAFKDTANVPGVSYLPLVTVRETVTIPPKLAQIIINLESFISLTYHIKVVMYLSAVMLLFWLSGHYYCLTSEGAASAGPDQRRPSRASEPGAAGSGQLRRPTLTSSMMNGGGGGGNGNGSASGANGLQRSEEPAGLQAAAASKRMSAGQVKLVNQGSDSVETRRDDKLGGGGGALAGASGSQHRGSLLLNGPRALGTLDEVGGGSGTQGGPAAVAVANAGDTTSSERANSADSCRSLPPSRHTSRLGSLSETSVELGEAAGATKAAGSHQRAANETSGGETNDAASAQDSSAEQRGGAGGPGAGALSNNRRQLKRRPTTRQSSRIFSKVDEQLEAARGNKIGAADGVARRAAAREQTSRDGGDPGDLIDDTASSGERPAADEPTASGGGGGGGCGDDGDSDGAPTGGRPRRKRKNWFMNVYSNFVQMLNGLRNTINDAGQLEINENDYRDKQLEMLAGKIDNWYNGHDDGGAGTAQGPPVAAADSAANSNTDPDGDGAEARSMVSPATVAPGGAGSEPAASDLGRSGGAAPAAASPARPLQTQADARADQEQQQQAASGGQPDARDKSGPTSDQMIANEAAASAPPPDQVRADHRPIGGEAEPAGEGVKADSLERQLVGGAGVAAGSRLEGAGGPGSDLARPPNAAPTTAEPSEPNSTERNGLNSRSMRVESSRAIDDDDGGGRGLAAGEAAATDSAAGTNAAAAVEPLGESAAGRPEGREQGEREAPAERGDGGRHSSELAADVASVARTFDLAGASAEETETEPETEADTEANELDKATTLDRIEAALNGSDEEMMANQLEKARASQLDPSGTNKADPSGRSSGAIAAAGAHHERASMINSSTSLDSVIDLKLSTQSGGPPNGIQLVNQSTTASGGQLAGGAADEHSLADKLPPVPNGLPRAGSTLTTRAAAADAATATLGARTNEPYRPPAKTGVGAAASMITRQDGAREKLVADDDETDRQPRRRRQQQQQQEEPVEMRAENSSKFLVSNSLLQPSGREQRLVRSNDDDDNGGGANDEDRPTRAGEDVSSLASSESRAGIKNAISTSAGAQLLSSDDCEQNENPNDEATPTSGKSCHQISDETRAKPRPASTANRYDQRQAIDEIQSANSPTRAIGPIDGGQIVTSDPLTSQAGGSAASAAALGEADAKQLSGPDNMANNGKQQQRQAHRHTNNDSITLQTSRHQQHSQHQYSTGLDGAASIDQRVYQRSAKPVARNNLRGPDGLDGNNILNGKIISHHHSQVARGGMRRLMADQLPVLPRIDLQLANHKQTTGGNRLHHHGHHDHHHQQRPVQPAGA